MPPRSLLLMVRICSDTERVCWAFPSFRGCGTPQCWGCSLPSASADQPPSQPDLLGAVLQPEKSAASCNEVGCKDLSNKKKFLNSTRRGGWLQPPYRSRALRSSQHHHPGGRRSPKLASGIRWPQGQGVSRANLAGAT